jgi:hypothetical protein
LCVDEINLLGRNVKTFLLKNLKGRDHLEDLGVNLRIILRLNLKMRGVWT